MSKGKREKVGVVGALVAENGASFMVAAESYIGGVVVAVDIPRLGQVVMELKPGEALRLAELLDQASLEVAGPRVVVPSEVKPD